MEPDLSGSVLRNLLQLSAFRPFSRTRGMHFTFVEEVNTNRCVCKASPYSFSFLCKYSPQFSPSLTDIFTARLWFGKLWVGKVQGQDVQNSTAHL